MIEIGATVICRKVSERPDSKANNLHLDYEVEGILMHLEPGERMVIDRWRRNDVKARGTLSTSPVESISGDKNLMFVTTENSVYEVERIK